MVAANKLLHLLEAFSTNWFLFSASQNHHLVFFLLEVFNNLIQYQFDGKTWLSLAQVPDLIVLSCQTWQLSDKELSRLHKVIWDPGSSLMLSDITP